MKYKFLIVDDDANMAVNLSKIIKENMPNLIENIKICNDGVETIEEIDKEKPDILLLDLKMPKANELTVIDKISEENIEIIIISGEASLINSLTIFNSKNIKKIYIKPFLSEHLIGELKYICHKKEEEYIRNKAEDELCVFSFNKCSIGYKYLIECLVKTYEREELLVNIEKDLFPLIAQKFHIKKIQNIKWSIQKTIKSMIRYTDTEKVYSYFPNTETLTPKLFIMTLNKLIITKYKK